jgi:biopolymer transport protein ExbD
MNDAFQSEPEIDEIEGDSASAVMMPKRPPMDDEMDITPMIDMTFLLLIFFILTSKMTAEQTRNLPPAKNGEVIGTSKCIILNVRASGGDNALVSRADETVFSDDPEQQAAEVAEYIQLGFNMQKTDILVRADGNVRNGEIKRIKEIVSESLEGDQMINLGVLDEQ